MGKHAACRASALAKVAVGGAADLTTCDTKLNGGFARAEAKGGCATTGDAGAVAAPIDNGDGTITDNQTGLQWEKKVNDPTSVHAVGLTNLDSWSADCTCATPDTCGREVPGQCSCTDNGLACSGSGQICGTRVNNCGQQVSCGTCPLNAPRCCVTSCVCANCVCP